MDNTNIAIELHSVVKKFFIADDTVTAIASLSANIKRGVITGIVGSDGAGKTTLMRMMAGLLTITEGHISVEGIDPTTEIKYLHDILGYMPQKFGLYEDLTVIENLVLYADLHGMIGKERESVFGQLLNFTGLKSYTKRRAGKLSGGMKQKLGLACALLGKPKVLLLDEPSVGVDPISRRELWKMVNTLVTEGVTVIWSTTYLYEASLCNEVLILNKGDPIYFGAPRKLIEKMGGHSFEDAFVNLLGGVSEETISLSKFVNTNIKNQNDVVIKVKGLTKKFDSFVAVNNINFNIKRGEIFCLLGPNGAGKSTTFKMLCGLLASTSGSAFILDIDLKKNPHLARQQLGYMAQKFSLYGDLTVQQNLHFFSGAYGLSGKKQTQIIVEMLNMLDLNQYLNTKSNELPLGFKQRLALACAIMHKPAILFLDEPTSGVDPIARKAFWKHINELAKGGITIVVTTHFMDEVDYCNNIGLIYRGELIASGSPDQIKQMVTTPALSNPSMEDAFVTLIEKHDKNFKLDDERLITNELDKFKIKTLQKIERNPFIIQHKSARCFVALCKKEFYQIIRDPSSILVAFILPLIMIFIFGFGINLDTTKLKLGFVMNDFSPEARRLEETYADSSYIVAMPMDLSKAKRALTTGDIRGFVMIQSDFSKKLKEPRGIAPVQIITDGSEPNTANFVSGYARGAWQTWLNIRAIETGKPLFTPINIEHRYWYNPAAISKDYIVPGSIVIIMTIIGAILTSLVIAREWERGTMEALLSTSVTRLEFIFSKLIPYYLVGIIAMLVCTITAITIVRAPFHGSIFLLFIETTLYLFSILGLGLLLSTLFRNQLVAAQAALNIAFLPSILLSGFIFEINNMPQIVQALTYFFPARYFVACLQTIFLAGNIGELLLKNAFFLFFTSVILLILIYKLTLQRLD